MKEDEAQLKFADFLRHVLEARRRDKEARAEEEEVEKDLRNVLQVMGLLCETLEEYVNEIARCEAERAAQPVGTQLHADDPTTLIHHGSTMILWKAMNDFMP